MSQRFVNCSEPLRKNKNNNNYLDLKRIKKIIKIYRGREDQFSGGRTRTLKRGNTENT